MSDERRLDVSTVAKRLGRSTMTIRNWIQSGKLKADREQGGWYRIPVSELDRLLRKKSPKSQASPS